MTKKDIVAKISGELDIEQIKVKKIVQMILDAIAESLSNGETVELRNFGIFKVKMRKARLWYVTVAGSRNRVRSDWMVRRQSTLRPPDHSPQ